MCLLKGDMGTDDVTNMQLLICAKYPHTPYSFTMIYFNQKARLLCTILKTFLFPCMTGCMTYFSDGCIWFLLQDKNRKFSARCEMFEALPMGNSWHDAQVLDAWDYMWKPPHGKSSRPVAWLCMTKFDRELWETRSGWRLLVKKLRLALGRLWHAWCWHFAPDIIQGSCAKRARKRAKRAQKGAKRARKKKCTTWPSCFHRHDVSRVFENPFYAWSEQKAWSEEKAPPCGLELVGGMLFQSEPSQFFHRTV